MTNGNDDHHHRIAKPSSLSLEIFIFCRISHDFALKMADNREKNLGIKT